MPKNLPDCVTTKCRIRDLSYAIAENFVNAQADIKPVSVEIRTGVKLHVETACNGKHNVLCIPGALAPVMFVYKAQFEHFGITGSEFTITSFDPIGYGKSREEIRRNFTIKPTHYLKQDTIDAYQGMKMMKIDKFSVLGWCNGGITGLFLASCFPHAVDKLVVWGSTSYITEEDIRLFESILKRYK